MAGERILAVTGAHGGPGITSVAMNLAWAVSSAGSNVLLVDADPDGGVMVHRLNLVGGRQLAALAQAGSGGPINPDFVRQATQRVTDYLGLVAGFEDPALATLMPPHSLGHLVEALEAINPAALVIVDVGRARSAWSVALIRQAAMVAWVTDPTADGLMAMHQYWFSQGLQPLPSQKTAVVVNRYNHPHALAQYAEALKHDFHLGMAGQIPHSPRAFADAQAKREFVRDRGVANAFRDLAEVLLRTPVSAEPTQRRSWFSRRQTVEA